MKSVECVVSCGRSAPSTVMSEELSRPVALVTGAGGGLGRALAIGLAADGFDVAVHCHRSESGAADTVAQIVAAGGKAQCLLADLRAEAGATALAIAVQAAFGKLDVLVNNAGIYEPKDLEALSEEQWFTGLNTTASAVFFTTRAVLPLLRAAPNGGRVINIGDGSCDRPSARDEAMAYHIGKTGVWMLTRSFAKRLAVDGVAVNLVSPGLLESSVGLSGDPSADGVPAGRYGSFDDVYSAVKFLATTENTYLTGANLTVGGAWNL
jgi:NAD(P)-dependent dehydrogenase (short-subunit alcohol dehydrogenase family)